MIKEINNWFSKKENMQKFYVVAGLMIVLGLMGVQIPLGTQSALGWFTGGLSFGVVLIIVGSILIFIPATLVAGWIMIGVGILVSGATLFSFLAYLESISGIPYWAFIIAAAGLSLYIKRRY